MLEARGTHTLPLGAGLLPLRPMGDLVNLLVHRRAITSHLFSHLHLLCLDVSPLQVGPQA